MPPTARDLYFAVRVEDRATGPLRRISAEMRRMSGSSRGVAGQRARLEARQQALLSAQSRDRARLEEISGRRALALDTMRTRNAKVYADANTRVSEIENRIKTNREDQIRQQVRINKLRRDEMRSVSRGGAPVRGMTTAELTALRASEQQRLRIMQSGAQQLQRRAIQADIDRANAVAAGNQKLAASEAEFGRRIQFVRTRLANQGDELASNATQIRKLQDIESRYLAQESLQKWSARTRMVEHLGHAITLLGVAATAAFGTAAYQAAQFQTQATLAATQARPVNAPIAQTATIAKQLNAVVLRQMREFPAASDEMNQALYDIFSGTNVQNIGQAARMLRIFNMEAVAGGTDLDTMVQAGITLYNNFPRQFANATSAGNKFFAMVRFGRGTATQFAQALNPIIPIAKQAGQSFDDVSTTLAFLSRQSRDVTQNAQGYARLLLLLARPEVRAGFKKIGVDVTDSQGRVRNLLDIITELRKRAKFSPTEALTFFKTISQQATGRGTAGTIQAQRVWARLLEGAKEYGVVSKQVLSDQGEFTKAFGALSQTPGVRWKIFTNQLRALVIQIGTGAIPVFGKLGREVTKAVDWFNSLSPGTRRAIGYFGAFIAVGTLVGGVLLTIVGGLASLVITLRLLTGARGIARLEAETGLAAGGLRGLGSEAGFISARLGIVGGAVAALLLVFHQWPGTFYAAANSIGFFVNQLGGATRAIEILFTALTIRAVAQRFGLFAAIGLQAAEANTAVTALRLSLLRLSLIGSIAILVTLLVDKKTRDDIGNFVVDTKNSIDDALINARNFVTKYSGQHLLGVDYKLTSSQRSDAEMQADIQREHRVQQQLINIRRNTEERILAIHRQAAEAMARGDQKRSLMLLRSAPQIHQQRGLFSSVVNDLNTLGRKISLTYQLIDLRGRNAAAKFNAVTQAAEQLGVTQITPSFQALFNNLIRTRRLAAQAQRALQLNPTAENSRKALAAWTTYQKALTALQANASKEQIAAAKKTADGVDTAAKAAVQKQKDNIKTAVDNISQMYEGLLQENQQKLGQLFSGPWLNSALMNFRKEWGIMPTGADLLKDVRGQVAQFRKFENALNTLRRRGAPPELISQLSALGPEALPNILLLTKMMPNQWKQYIAAFKEGQELVKQQTMRDLQAQLKLYRSYGANVGKQIVLGIRDQSAPMRSEIRSLVLQMFPELKTPRAQHARTQAATTPAAPPAPPSNRNRRPPVHTPQPGAGGTTHQNPGVKKGDVHYHDHWNIHQKPSEDIATALQRVRFRQKNRPRIRR